MFDWIMDYSNLSGNSDNSSSKNDVKPEIARLMGTNDSCNPSNNLV